MTRTWTVREVLAWTSPHFEKKGVDAPRLTAEVLLAHVLGVDRVRLYVDLDRPLNSQELGTFRQLIERRGKGEPTQYLTGTREFYKRPFQVDARVLIPRPETELLVEAVLRHLPKQTPAHVLDLCTGSGCIAVSVAAEAPHTQVVATDVSPEACDVAQTNAVTLGVGKRVQVHRGDLFAALAEPSLFDVIVSNPPYVASAEVQTLSAEVQKEPRLALDGGPQGLSVLQRIVEDAPRWLKPGGLLALEIGETQGKAVQDLLSTRGFENVRIECDWEHRQRLAFGTALAQAQSQGRLAHG